jgi:phage virion morphogenesis protein
MIRFRVLIFGTEALSTRLTRMAKDTADARPAFNNVADELMRVTNIQFESQGRRGGGAWARLSPKWLKEKAKITLDLRILHLDHTLRHSVTRRGAPGQVLEIGPTEMNFGSNVKYARVHQEGYPPRNIPRRPFIKLIDSDRRNIRNMIRDHIMTGGE